MVKYHNKHFTLTKFHEKMNMRIHEDNDEIKRAVMPLKTIVTMNLDMVSGTAMARIIYKFPTEARALRRQLATALVVPIETVMVIDEDSDERVGFVWAQPRARVG